MSHGKSAKLHIMTTKLNNTTQRECGVQRAYDYDDDEKEKMIEKKYVLKRRIIMNRFETRFSVYDV